jgi:hypothetical protein
VQDKKINYRQSNQVLVEVVLTSLCDSNQSLELKPTVTLWLKKVEKSRQRVCWNFVTSLEICVEGEKKLEYHTFNSGQRLR